MFQSSSLNSFRSFIHMSGIAIDSLKLKPTPPYSIGRHKPGKPETS